MFTLFKPMRKWKSLSHALLFATPWTIQSMEFFRPEYWSGMLFPSPGIFPTQGSNPCLPHYRWILYQLSHRENQKYRSMLPIPSQADLPIPGIEPGSPELQADSLPTELWGKPSHAKCQVRWSTIGIKIPRRNINNLRYTMTPPLWQKAKKN